MSVRILIGDVRERLADMPDESVHCCVTSPPYFGLRDYGVAGQIGLEPSPEAYVAEIVGVFREVRRVLRKDGTLWLNLGDSYAAQGARTNNNGTGASGLKRDGRDEASRLRSNAKIKTAGMALPPLAHGCKPKDLLGIPWRVAFALQADGWWLRSDIIWAKPNPMPESVTDRPTSAHEHLFLLAKSATYYYDADAVREPFADERMGDPGVGRSKDRLLATYGKIQDGLASSMPHLADRGGRNLRNVWTIATEPFSEAHFATFPPSLIEPCIKAGCPASGTVLDPFGGAGTAGLVADRLGRDAILIELNPAYAEMARGRIHGDAPLFAEVSAA